MSTIHTTPESPEPRRPRRLLITGAAIALTVLALLAWLLLRPSGHDSATPQPSASSASSGTTSATPSPQEETWAGSAIDKGNGDHATINGERVDPGLLAVTCFRSGSAFRVEITTPRGNSVTATTTTTPAITGAVLTPSGGKPVELVPHGDASVSWGLDGSQISTPFPIRSADRSAKAFFSVSCSR